MLLLALFTCVVIGCGDGSATVSGVVTLDGQPVVGGPEMQGMVTFHRAGGGGAPAVGIIDATGRYTLKTGASDRVEPGDYEVSVAVKRIHPPTTPGGMPRAEQITPSHYATARDSGLRAAVEPGRNTFDFALRSEPSG